MLECILYSSCSYYELVGDQHNIGGTETEIGMINLLLEHMQRWIYESKIREILDENKYLSQVPYNSENQWHAIVVDRERLNRVFMIPEVQAVLDRQDSIFAKGGATSKTLIVKGIPEALLPKCTFFLDKDGLHTPLLA